MVNAEIGTDLTMWDIDTLDSRAKTLNDLEESDSI